MPCGSVISCCSCVSNNQTCDGFFFSPGAAFSLPRAFFPFLSLTSHASINLSIYPPYIEQPFLVGKKESYTFRKANVYTAQKLSHLLVPQHLALSLRHPLSDFRWILSEIFGKSKSTEAQPRSLSFTDGRTIITV